MKDFPITLIGDADHAEKQQEAVARLTKQWVPEPRIYRIIRFHQQGRPRTIRNNVTLTEAQAHCRREDTHGVRGGVRWFDGYDYMRGCKPRECKTCGRTDEHTHDAAGAR